MPCIPVPGAGSWRAQSGLIEAVIHLSFQGNQEHNLSKPIPNIVENTKETNLAGSSRGNPFPQPEGDLTSMPFSTFGYPSKEPCAVCGIHKNNQMEPRFSYVVCEDHQSTPPTEITRAKRSL
jgi:hypothetical protein